MLVLSLLNNASCSSIIDLCKRFETCIFGNLFSLQVDIIQMGVLEFENRDPEDRFYHLEHYIEGHYTKYNSNSGFVEENIRFTPQACKIYLLHFGLVCFLMILSVW